MARGERMVKTKMVGFWAELGRKCESIGKLERQGGQEDSVSLLTTDTQRTMYTGTRTRADAHGLVDRKA